MSFDLFDSPELLDIQRKGFYRFLNQGISHLLSKQFPIKVKNGSYSIELWLNEQNIKLIAPDSSPRDCILNMKTYSCKLYAQVKIVCKKQGSDSENHLLCNTLLPYPMQTFGLQGEVQKGVEKTCKASLSAPLQSGALYVQRNSPSQSVKNFAFGIQKARLAKLALRSGALYTPPYKAPYTRTKQSFVGTPFLQSSALYASPLCSTQNNVKTWERENIKQKLFSSAGLLSLSNNKQDSIVYQSMPEWVLLGQLPMMTKRGHFIINGSPRVIVHQVVRSPGIYFQKLVKKEDQNFARFYGDIIPLKGVWVRLQMTKKGRIEAKFKKGKKVQVEFLQKCLQVIEDQASLSESYWHDRADVARTKLVQTQLRTKRSVAKEEQSFVRAMKSINLKVSSNYNLLYEDFSTLLDKRKNRAISKAEHDAFIYTYDKLYRTTQDKELEEWQRKKNNLYFFKGLNPENAFKRKKCSENLFASFKIPSRYDLGSLGREKINDKFGLGANYTNTKITNSVACFVRTGEICKERGRSFRVKQALKKNKYLITQQRLEKEPELYNCIGKEQQLTAMDLSAASVWLYKLRKGEKFTDDIDHSQNRRVRTSGELLETQFENGVDRLKILLSTKLKEWRTSFSDPTFSSLFKSSYRIRYNDQCLFKRSHQISFAGFQNTKIKKFQVRYHKKTTFLTLKRFLLSAASFLGYRSLSNTWHLPARSFATKRSFVRTDTNTKRSFVRASLCVQSSALQTLCVQSSALQRGASKLTVCKERSFANAKRSFARAYKSKICKGSGALQRTWSLQSGADALAKRSFASATYGNVQMCKGANSYKAALNTSKHKKKNSYFDKAKFNQSLNSFNEKFYKISVKEVFSTKPITGALREFFGSNPLSQYMDQTNPLAEITHKRRISSLGVGGVSRESAGMAIRGIHPTHYGRICPIETPEGKNAGLVNSLAFYTKVDVNGFLKTPYYRVVKGQIQSSFGFSFTSAKEELLTGLYIAPSDLQKSSNNILRTKNTLLETVPVRVTDNQLDVFKKESPNKVKLIGISPIQMISVATSLIPFLEHNDANRALMGSNMQRQAVPLMIAERPIVGTGLESIVIVESGHITESQTSGFAGEVTASRIIIDRLCLHTRKGSRALYEKLPKVRTLHVQSSALYRCMRGFVRTPLFAFPLSKTLRIGTYVQKGIHLQTFDLYARAKRSFAKPRSLQRTCNVGRFVCKLYKEGAYKSKICMYVNVQRKSSFFMSSKNYLTTFSRSNQNTCITEKPLIQEFDWVQRGDILSDCSASNNGELAVGKNVLVAYIPWEGYNFEDAIVISERLVREHVYTSLHIERYTFQAQDLKDGNEWFTKNLPGIEDRFVEHLEESGLPKIGSFLKEGDIIVGKIRYLNKKPSSPYERLLCDILGEKNFAARNKSLYVPKGVEARVIYHRVINQFDNEPDNKVRPARAPRTINVFLGEKRAIQVGDKISGRHGNKGVISTILPRQDMPYLPDGTPIDVILNPLGVPSRMNVGQVLECLLGLAANYLNQHFKITAFDERYGVEASKSIVFLKLYQARLQSGQNWLFQVNFPGKTRLVDGRSGLCFDQWITVGKAYILKLIHMVSEKIHARSTGPYALITQQPLRGRSNKGGQRLGEMEVWALEGFGAAYTLQELLTKKSDDFFGRKQIVDSILPNPSSIVDTLKPDFRIHQSRPVLGHPEIFKVLLCELQALCLDLGVYIVTPESFQRSFLGIVH